MTVAVPTEAGAAWGANVLGATEGIFAEGSQGGAETEESLAGLGASTGFGKTVGIAAFTGTTAG